MKYLVKVPMKKHSAIAVSLAIFSLVVQLGGIAKASSQVPQSAISKCVAYAKSKGMMVKSSNSGKHIDYQDQFWIRVFGSKGKSKNVAATCDWTPKFGGKLTYNEELDFMDH